MFRTGIAAVCIGLLASGCASTPRPYTASIAPRDAAAAADPAAAEAVLNKCKVLVAEGRRSDFASTAASAGVGLAAGTGTVAYVAPAIIYASAGAAWALLGAATGVGAAAAYGVSRAARANKEREIKSATEQCLGEHGYRVTGWELVEPPKQASASRERAPTARPR
ncbi:MAG: hypothetical protein M3M95_08035 [Pseudomonadota bacterium]|nr:hypothetical protein [Pseudomonadota bacterium]